MLRIKCLVYLYKSIHFFINYFINLGFDQTNWNWTNLEMDDHFPQLFTNINVPYVVWSKTQKLNHHSFRESIPLL